MNKFLVRKSSLIGCRLMLMFAVACAAASPSNSQSSSQTTGTAAITGRVMMGDTPASGITLALLPQGGRPMGGPGPQSPDSFPRTTTDEQGRYRFANVASGSFRVVPLTEVLVQTSNNGRGGITVSVTDGQTLEQVDITMARGGVITGRVTDSAGRPVIAERINLQPAEQTGQGQPAMGGPRAGAETDDRGIYRIYGLPAGRYVVSAGNEGNRPGVSRRVRYPRTFYPDALDQAQAQAVEVTSGSVTENIDIRFGEPIKTYSIQGRAVDADSGQPVLAVPINASVVRGDGQRGPGGPAGVAGSGSTTNAEGEFRLTNLTPGRYSLAAQTSGFQGANTELANDFYSDPVSVEVGSDNVTGVEVKVHRGATISGVVVIEGANDPSAAQMLSQMMVSANSRGAQTQGQGGRGGGGGSGRQNFAQVSPNGSFRIGGIAPGSVRINVNGFGGFGGGGSISLVRIERSGAPLNGDLNVAGGDQIAGLRVVVAYGTGVIQGRVVVAGGALPAGTRLMVIARSTNSSAGGGNAGSLNRPGQVDTNGNFRIEGLLPGSYEVRLQAMGGFGGGQRGGGPQRGGGVGGGGNRTQVSIPDVRQVVNVANGTPAAVTLTLNLTQ